MKGNRYDFNNSWFNEGGLCIIEETLIEPMKGLRHYEIVCKATEDAQILISKIRSAANNSNRKDQKKYSQELYDFIVTNFSELID